MKKLLVIPLLLLLCQYGSSQTIQSHKFEVVVDRAEMSEKDFDSLKVLLNAKEIKLTDSLSILKSEKPRRRVLIDINDMPDVMVKSLKKYSYESLFHPTQADMTSQQRDQVQDIEKQRGRNYHVVELASLRLANITLTQGFDINEDHGAFYLPVKKDSIVIVSNGRYRNEGGRTIFTGALDNNTGEVFLMNRNDSIIGVVNTPTKTYSIIPIGNRQHVITEEKTEFKDEEPKRLLEKQQKNDSRDTQGADRLQDGERAEIRLLVLYTDAVDNYYSGQAKRILIEPSVERTNQSIVDSGMGNLRFVLAGAQKVAYTESETWERHLDVLLNPNDGTMDEVFNLRNRFAADIVVLIVKTEGPICGEAATIGPDIDNAFAVVKASCSLNYYSFGHEIGHLFGCRHDFCVDNSVVPFSYGHGFIKQTPASWRCVMSYGNCCNGCPRIGIWSNPNLVYDGTTAGSIERENNIEVLRQSAKVIQGFR